MDEARIPDDSDEEIPPAPLTFKLAVALAGIYLGWRLIQGVVWLFQQVF